MHHVTGRNNLESLKTGLLYKIRYVHDCTLVRTALVMIVLVIASNLVDIPQVNIRWM